MTDYPTNLVRSKGLSKAKQALLERRLRGDLDSMPQADTIPVRTETGPVPLSFVQERFWFMSQLDPNSPAYNMYNAIHLRGRLNSAILRESIRSLIHRHQILRTQFVTEMGRPYQVIVPDIDFEIPVIDLPSVSPPEKESQVQARIKAEIQRPFDLSECPLFRVLLLKQADDDHILVLTIHHIIADEWSNELFWRELSALYRALSSGQTPSLPDLPVQYADFALWQKERVNKQMEAQLAYWKKQLADAAPVLQLPADRPRPAVQTFVGRLESMTLPGSLLQDLRALNQQAGTTMFMTFLAAFKVLLHRYSGQNDILVGTPVANRTRPETEKMLGLLLNSLVLRTDFSRDQTFVDLLRQVKQTALDALAHQDLPFEKLVEELAPTREASYNPLFQVMVVSQRDVFAGLEFPGLTAEAMQLDAEVAKFDLTLFINEGEEALTATIEYNTDLYDRSTIQRLLSHLRTLLFGIVADPTASLAKLPILPSAEREQILVAWNKTEADYPKEACVHHLIEAQAEQVSEQVAVVYEDESLTYGQLNERANQLARYLQGQGVGPNSPVAICAERSLDMIVGILGILKAGGAYVPLDPTYPKRRLAAMLADIAPAENPQTLVLLTQQHLLANLPEQAGRMVCLDRDWPVISREATTAPGSQVTADDLAYIIYTSGSTGVPKGVMVSHRNLVHSTTARLNYYPEEFSAFLLLSSFSFDSSLVGIFWSLCAGKTLLLPQQEQEKDVAAIASLINRHAVSHLLCVPSLYDLLLTYALPEQLSSLVNVIVAGEACPRNLVERHFSQMPATALYNEYGPSEGTVWCTVHKLSPQDEARTIPIGRPIANMQAYILDQALQPVPIGLAGELHIAGAGLARGYLNRPDLTAEKFIQIPPSLGGGESTSARLYKTGDLARYLPNGNIEFLGRIDHQVKVRGFRIELGEIEAVLQSHPQLLNAAVLVREDKPGHQYLVGYLIAQDDTPSSAELQAFAKQYLPDYMVPATFVSLEHFPTSPNGKIDYKAFPAPDRSSIERSYVAPRTKQEAALAEIWAEVLDLDTIGIHDNFFDLGGHSLLATRIIARTRQALQFDLPLRALFEAPTIAELAAHIAAINQPGLSERIEPVTTEEAMPLSFAQQRIWFLTQLERNTSFYNMPLLVRLTGELDVAALEKSINDIVGRHATLRTTFSSQDGQPRQHVAPALTLSLPVTDLSHLPPAEREGQAQQVVTAEEQIVFDLEQGPLLQVHLIRLAEDEHLFSLIMHHLISDGWSFDLFKRELSAFYAGYRHNQPLNLLDLPIQYTDYAAWQREWLAGDKPAEQLTYWKQKLAGASQVLELPADRSRPPVLTHHGGHLTMQVPCATSKGLKQLSQQADATMFMTMLAALNVLLYRYTGQEDLIVGTPIANRSQPEIEGLIGLFLNNLALRIDCSGDPGFLALVEQVRQVALAAYSHQEIPFEKLLEELSLDRDPSRTPLFQVFFNMLSPEDQSFELPGLTVATLPINTAQANFDLTLYAQEAESGISLRLVYNADLFDHERMIELLNQYAHLLGQVIENPGQPISTFSLGTETAKSVLPDPSRPLSDTWYGAVHQRFSQQAAQQPDHLAVIDHQTQWTYADLNQRSNQLAHHLLAAGIQPGDVVVVYAHRSAALVWAVLGILKAGAAFMMLDPAYPTTRLIDFLRTAQPEGLINLAKAGPLPDEVADFVSRSTCRCQISLPALDIPEFLQNCPTEDPPMTITPNDLAYIAFTSGSTGQPKGVLGRHGPLSHFLPWHKEVFELTADDRFSMLSGLSHDPLQRDIFTPLWVGATLCIPDAERFGAPGYLASWMAEEKITLALLTPPLSQLIVDTAASGLRLPHLDHAIFIGDKLSQHHVEQLRQLAPDVNCVNTYGATETQRALSFYPIPPDQVNTDSKAVYPLGRGMPDVQLLLLNRAGQMVGIGELGEIYIRSPHLASGYLDDPVLTADRFLLNPFGTVPEDRMYKTGDLGRYRLDGTVEFVSRADRQIKIRGFRIEPGEIETALTRHPDIQEAVVMVRVLPQRDLSALVAYVVPAPSATLMSESLRNFLNARLPHFMIPSVFIKLTAIPLTPNAKIDYQALPEPDLSAQLVEETYLAPRNDLEQELVNIWQEVLKLERVGIHDNFFDLGGHSLLAVDLFSRIENIFGEGLPLAAIFQSPTVEQLAQALQQEGWEPSQTSLVPIQAQGQKLPFFCVTPPMGSVVGFARLAHHLGTDQPFYGLHLDKSIQLRAFDEHGRSITRPEDVAAHYIQEIRRVQPHGPYFIGGRCYGAYVAFELAQQLLAQGEEVGLLVMLAARPHDFQTAKTHYAQRLVHHAKAGRLSSVLRHSLYQMVRNKGKRLVRKVHNRGRSTTYAYEQRAYPGKIAVFQTSRATEKAWSKLAQGGLDFRVVEGTHLDMFHEPNVQRLSAELADSLAQAQIAVEAKSSQD